VEEILPDSFISRIPILGQMPLFDLIEELIRIFGVGDHPGDLPYIQALQDLVVEVQRRESMSLPVFLEYWDQFGSTRGIGISEHSDAIRILTIHRSKGLEFRAVVVPFVHWEITTGHRKANILWCSTRGTGFGQVPLVPVRYGSDMKETLFSASYYEERMKGYLDNLNLLYVAFTRAVEVLYAAVPLRGAEGIRTVGDLFPAILQKEPSAEPSLGPLSRYLEGGLLEAGRMPGIEAEPLPPDPWKFVSYDTRTGDPLPKLRLQGEWRLTGEEGEPRSGRNFGNLMHLAFSRITGRDDVPQALEELVKAGLLSVKERPELEKQILEMVSRQVVKDWFRGRESVFRERSILCGNGQVVRPDRVMIDGQRATVIDFKFGRHEREEYVRQVAHYMELLREMGYDPVEGFLWYAALDRIQKIEM
jgi:ATP-dependent helicase/nuclease subunit A